MSLSKSAFSPLIFTLTLSACGGGGGGSDSNSTSIQTEDANQTFSLSKLLTTAQGPVYNAQLTGSDSDGTSFTGSISMANGSQETLDGVLVTPRDLIISLSPTTGSSITVTSTGYTDESGYTISLEVQTTGVTCAPASPYRLPDSVTIGDLGILSTLSCSDGTTQETNWRVEDAGNGRALIITNGTMKSQSNNILSTTDVTYTIDSSGNIVKFKTVSTQVDESFTLSYESV